MSDASRESSNFRPGEPLRSWSEQSQDRAFDAALIMKSAAARVSVMRLLAGDDITESDLITFGRLNSWCVQLWFEPIVNLMGPPIIDPDFRALVARHPDLLG